jgi:uncharacterized membrane protein
MTTRHKHDIIILVSLIGFGIAVYLSVYHYLGYAIPCSITHGCSTVLSSRFSAIFGLPVSVWGLAYFVGLIFSAIMANHYRTWQTILTALLSFGALGALFFLGDQFFVIKKVCEYCFTTDTLIILMFLWNLNVAHRPASVV